ncbi:N-acetyl-gamma-glutamyl-phosphate reductase [plant metagenome]|uniref:N-acetyl-gamma-glutamyl-phosphate reductase n=1 Tax=plant metagenome TaxID=1297885 RepID=A0A484R344_9ZZZZ
MASTPQSRIKVGIVGGTGYTGVELLRLLSQHPHVALTAITSRKEDGMPVAEMYPNLRGRVDLAFSSPDKAPLSGCDVVFFATPHGVAMAQARELLDAGVRVIDLAADFRLKDIPTFQKWYKIDHACPDVLEEAVYGLVELDRAGISRARHRQPRLLSHHGAAGPGPRARGWRPHRHAPHHRRLQVGRHGRRPQG